MHGRYLFSVDKLIGIPAGKSPATPTEEAFRKKNQTHCGNRASCFQKSNTARVPGKRRTEEGRRTKEKKRTVQMYIHARAPHAHTLTHTYQTQLETV